MNVSVIIPVYNVEPYLDEALSSVMGQTMHDFEVIAVNDGSTDGSEEILKRYQEQYPHFHYYNQPNQGQSAARNLALRYAQGEYIYFMDADDKIATDMLRTCYEYAEKTQADFIFFDGDKFYDEGAKQMPWNYKRTHLLQEDTRYDGEALLKRMLDTGMHNCVVWLLLIRRAYLERIGLRFYEGIIHEDELFTTILTLSSSNIFCLQRNLVYHRIRKASTMGISYSQRNINCYLTVADELLRFRQTPIIHQFLRYTLSIVFYTGHLIPLKEKPAVFWRAIRSGYLRYIGLKSSLVFWLKRHAVLLAVLVGCWLSATEAAGQPTATDDRSCRAANSKLSAWVREACQEEVLSRRAAENGEERYLTAFVKTSNSAEEGLLEQYGCRTLARCKDISIASIPFSGIEALASHPDVMRIEASGRAQTTMDTVPRICNILPIYESTERHPAFTGSGVVVGVMDVGFDLRHPTFYNDETLSQYRISAFWDQLSPDTIGSTLPVGRDYVGPEKVLAKGCATDAATERHGTHTAGTAVGCGYNSPYRGVAFESDICLVANAVTSDTIYIAPKDYYKYTSATDALGFKYIMDYAEAQQKPCVASFSEGYSPYMDEEDLLFSEFLDGLSGPGRIIVVSAGNENLERTYVDKPAGQEEAGAFLQVFKRSAHYRIQADGPMGITLAAYADGSNSPTHRLQLQSDDCSDEKPIKDTLFIGKDTCAIMMSVYPSAFSEGDRVYLLELKANHSLNNLAPIALIAQHADTHVQIFGSSSNALQNRDTDGRWSHAAYGHNILAPGCFKTPITVGSTSHRRQFTSATGKVVKDSSGEMPGRRSFFSSTGPTMDGHTKPDVTAPGQYVIASLSSYYLEAHPGGDSWDTSYFDHDGRTFVWGAYSGTSMSTPIVAGTIALWLQAKPTLTRDDIIATFQRTCRQPDETLTYPNNEYGYGEIDAYQGLLDILNLTMVDGLSHHQPQQATITVSKGHLVVTIKEVPQQPFTMSVFSLDGTLVYRQQLTTTATTTTVPLPPTGGGVFAVQLTGAATITGSQLIRIAP